MLGEGEHGRRNVAAPKKTRSEEPSVGGGFFVGPAPTTTHFPPGNGTLATATSSEDVFQSVSWNICSASIPNSRRAASTCSRGRTAGARTRWKPLSPLAYTIIMRNGRSSLVSIFILQLVLPYIESAGAFSTPLPSRRDVVPSLHEHPGAPLAPDADADDVNLPADLDLDPAILMAAVEPPLLLRPGKDRSQNAVVLGMGDGRLLLLPESHSP